MPSGIFDPECTPVASGDWLPGYEINGVIGSGGSGQVFQARQLKLNRTVALKVIRIDKVANPTLAARFESEAVTLAKFHHPNIVQVYDYGYHENRLFIAMELLEGEDLGQRIKRLGPLDERTAWSIIRQAASALNYANGLGVVHRDIKPPNLFLVPAPTGFGLPPDVPLVKVADFGLALTKMAPCDNEGRLTDPGTVLGTPVYMAPEQFRRAADIDHRADIYGLGATIFHALDGRPPFDGTTAWEVMAQKLEHSLRSRPNAAPGSSELIDAMMAREPNQRIGTYEELIDRVEHLLTFFSMATTPKVGLPAVSPSRTGRSKWRYAAVTAGALAACGIGSQVMRPSTHVIAGPNGLSMDQYTSTGEHQALFNSNSIVGWLPPAAGGHWRIEPDDEGAKVLIGTGFTRRTFAAMSDYSLTIGLDVFDAAAAEVHFAIPARSPDNARRLVLRVSKLDGAAFGMKDGDKGELHPFGKAVPFPKSERFKESRPYIEVRVTRAGNAWSASFDGKEKIVGRMADDGSPKLSEFRVFADGGMARIDSVILERLRYVSD
jgi:eukaryotic-like serine/threonine-protein kinase